MEGPPSPTGSAATVSFPLVKVRPKYDNLGPRTTADGSSKLSLNNIGDGGGSTPSKAHQPSLPLVTGTLGRHSMLRSNPLPGPPKSHFAPIAEVEPIMNPGEDVTPGNDEVFDQPHNRNGLPKPTSPSFKTEPASANGTLKSKKVPPKPPPKPTKKKPSDGNLNGGIHSPQKSAGSQDPVAAAIAGDDGTEV
jgi:hypothetical protein